MEVKCIDDYRIYNKKGEQVATYWENDIYDVDEKLVEELLATGNFEKVE